MRSSGANLQAVPRKGDERQEAKARKSEVAHRFGRSIKRLREALGVSGSDLAQRLDYTPAALWNIENEQTDGPPQLDRVLMALEALGINPELFWTLLEGPIQTPPRAGADPEIEQQLSLMAALGEQVLAMVQDLRRRVQGQTEDSESPKEE